jgi:hypothetical protein
MSVVMHDVDHPPSSSFGKIRLSFARHYHMATVGTAVLGIIVVTHEKLQLMEPLSQPE